MIFGKPNQHVLPLKIFILVCMAMNSVDCGIATRFDELYEAVLNNYSSKTPPIFSLTDTVTVKLTAYAVNINQFDEMSGELSLTMAFTFTWVDKRLTWNNPEYNNISSIPVHPEDLWRPQVYLLESSDTVVDIADTTVQARLHRDGGVILSTGKVVKVACSVDVKYFPFDTQICYITLLNWALYNNEMTLKPLEENVQKPHLNHNSQWELRPSTLSSCSQPEFEKLPCIGLKIVLKRRSSFYVVYIIVPLILLGTTNNIVFLMPASSGERTSVAVTIFLSFVVYMDIVNDLVPQSSRPMAYIYTYILYLLLYSCVSLALCVISLRIYNKDSAIPAFVVTAIWYTRFRFIWLRTPRKGQVRINDVDIPSTSDRDIVQLESFDREMTGGTNRDTNPDRGGQKAADDVGIKFRVTWDIVGKTFDFYCFVLLALVFMIISVVTFESLRQNKGLYT